MSISRRVLDFFIRELDIFFHFSWRDWSTTIIPGSIIAFGAMKTDALSFPSVVPRYGILLSWLTAHIYFFNLSNQITGLHEDQINKPNRPIPSGKVTVTGAKQRLCVVVSLYIAIAIYQGTLLLDSVFWIFTTAFLCLTSAGNHWLGKNCIAMTTGTWGLLSASWKAITPATQTSQRYALAAAIWVGLSAHIQDLRDVKGDAAVRRKTLPIVFGDAQSRLIITFLLLPAAILVLWMGGIANFAPFTLVALHIYLGYRIMHAKGAKYDHKTYMMYTYVFCFILVLTTGIFSESDVSKALWKLDEASLDMYRWTPFVGESWVS